LVAAAWPGAGPVVATVAALRAEKNLGRLVRAFAVATGAQPADLAPGRLVPARLVIIGDGPERAGLEKLVAQLAEAREKATLGQWREAIHLGFWAAVSRLESDGVWRPDKARTPREYLNAIPTANESRTPFAAVTKTFEAAWYGGRPASAGEFEGFMSELEKLGCRG